MTIRRALIPPLMLMTGCYAHRWVDRNAPGETDVSSPPVALRASPSDPGQQGMLLSAGALGGITTAGSPTMGFETSASWYADGGGPNASSGWRPSLVGANVGWVPWSSALSQGTVYAELQAALDVDDVAGVSTGWAQRLADGAGGPQTTLFWGPLWVRGLWLPGHGAELQVGLVLKGYGRLSWFR